MWQFTKIRALVIDVLDQSISEPISRIMLARKYSIAEWLIPALNALAQRREPLRAPELHDLGLDFAAPVRVTPLSSAGLFTRVLAGRGMAGAPGVLFGHDLDRIEVRCDLPLPLQTDGEDLGDVTEALFEIERDAVTVLV